MNPRVMSFVIFVLLALIGLIVIDVFPVLTPLAIALAAWRGYALLKAPQVNH